MAYNAPTTNRASGFVPTSTNWKREYVDNAKFLQYQGCMGRTHGNHLAADSTSAPTNSIASGVATTLKIGYHHDTTWQTVNGMLTSAEGTAATGQITIPSGMDGVWIFDGWVAIQGHANLGEHVVQLRQNAFDWDVFRQGSHGGLTCGPIISFTFGLVCAAGDTVELRVIQNSGAARYVTGWLHGQWFSGNTPYAPGFSPILQQDVGTTATHTTWNQMMGNIKFLHDRPFCWVTRSTTQTINNATTAGINFTAADRNDAWGMHNPGAGSPVDSFTVCPYDGIYLVVGNVTWTGTANWYGHRSMFLVGYRDRGDGTLRRLDGEDISTQGYTMDMAMGSPCGTNAYVQTGAMTIVCRANDNLQLAVYQDNAAAANLTVQTAEMQTFYLGGHRLSADGDQLNRPPLGVWMGR